MPLLRVQDAPSAASPTGFLSRNEASIGRVTVALCQREVVLVVPEGISHDAPTMAPLKSGAARIALQARGSGIQALMIVPIGLVYEAKERMQSHVLIRIGTPIDVDVWCVEHPIAGPGALTREITHRLERAALGAGSQDQALQSIRLARTLAALRQYDRSAARRTRIVAGDLWGDWRHRCSNRSGVLELDDLGNRRNGRRRVRIARRATRVTRPHGS